MKFQVREPAGVVEAAEPVTTAAAVIEELPSSSPLRAQANADRWLVLVLAACAGLVGLGFAGHTVAPPPTTGSTVESSTPQTGEPSTSAPPQSTSVVAVSSVQPSAPSPQLERTLNGWHATATMVGPTTVTITIDGSAPSTVEEVSITVRTRSGRLLAPTVGVVAVDDERPGSSTVRRRELGTFHVAIDLPGAIPAGGWQVDVGWRDPSDGSWGSSSQLVPATGG
jgi:hypothetical protein